MTTCYGYTRVSTAKQGEGVSLEAQKDEIIRYAQKHDLTISHWFEEKETAAKTGRPIFNRIIQDLLHHKADGLIVHKIDRSARNFRDWAKIGELADQGIGIHFATESLDFQSRGGRLTADIQAVIASDYIRNLREEAKKGLNGRLKQGLYPFRAPIGYLDKGRGNPKEPDPAKAPLIKEMYELYLTGEHGIRSLHAEMEKRGLRNLSGGVLSRHGVETILSNPFYCGIIRIARTGETFDGCHDALISTAMFQRVQDMKAGKCGKKTTRHMHTYRGLFKCQLCKMAMIAERQKGHVYYRCHTPDCQTKGIREEAIEQSARDLFERLQIERDQFAQIVAAMEIWQENRRSTQDDEAALRLQLGKLEARQEALTDALIEGLIDKGTYSTRKAKFALDRKRIADALALKANLVDAQASLKKFLELVNNLAPLYENATLSEKRNLVRWTTSNRTITRKSVYFEPCNWLEVAQNVLAAPYGEPLLATSRTGPEYPEQQLESVRQILRPESEPVELEYLMNMFDKYISGPKTSDQANGRPSTDMGLSFPETAQ